MKNGDRITVYLVGFVVGTMLVSLIMGRRASEGDAPPSAGGWVAGSPAVADSPPLPEGVPEALRGGTLVRFGRLGQGPEDSAENAGDRVWVLSFDANYPFVRVVEDADDGGLRYMAADQVVVRLAEGTDVTELKPMLEALGVRLRMFNRGERIAVIGVVGDGIGAVPETLRAAAPYSALFREIRPDWIRFRD